MQKQHQKKHGPGLAACVGNTLGRLSGLSFGQRLLWQSLSPLHNTLDPLKLLWKFRQNAVSIGKLPFSEIKVRWGIVSAKDEALACKSQQCAVFAGLALFAFGLALCFLEENPAPLLAWALRCAAISVSLLGAVLAASSLWRLSCLRKGRFIPFWLCLRGH